ncbi:HAAS signaling domain-containing protein [Micromonospora sp. NPDC003197]
MTVTTDQEIARYVNQVRVALADLPVATQDELLEDLPEHLAEVAAEADGSLVERLGSPETYANELRLAAGVGPAAARRNLDQRVGTTVVAAQRRLRAADVRLGPIIGYAKLSDFLGLLRPAWWVLRGYLVAMFITVAANGWSIGLLPRLGGSIIAAMLLLTVCVVASIWFGRRSRGFSRWPRWTIRVATGLLVFFGFVAFVDADGRSREGGYFIPSSVDNTYQDIRDVYVYDSQGRLVEGARLFDQDGRPIRLGYHWCADSQAQIGVSEPNGGTTYPYCPEGAPFRFEQPRTSTTPSPSVTIPGPEVTSPGEFDKTPIEQPVSPSPTS